MDVLELRNHYERLTDDQILRVWADKEGLTEVALSVLSEQMRGRGLLQDPKTSVRIAELKADLADNRRRYERGQRRIFRGLVVRIALPLIGAAVCLVLWLIAKSC